MFPFEHTAQISSFCELCERLIDACRLSLSVSPEKDWTRFKEPNVKLSSVLSVWLLLKCDNSQEKELEIHYSDLLTKCYTEAPAVVPSSKALDLITSVNILLSRLITSYSYSHCGEQPQVRAPVVGILESFRVSRKETTASCK